MPRVRTMLMRPENVFSSSFRVGVNSGEMRGNDAAFVSRSRLVGYSLGLIGLSREANRRFPRLS